MTMITPSYLGETIEYSSLHACRSTLEDPTNSRIPNVFENGFQRRKVRMNVVQRRDSHQHLAIRPKVLSTRRAE